MHSAGRVPQACGFGPVARPVAVLNRRCGRHAPGNQGTEAQQQGCHGLPRYGPCRDPETASFPGKPGNEAETMAAEKDAELSEVTRLRQHPNRSCPASTQTTEQTKNCCRGVLILVIFAGSRKTKVNGYRNDFGEASTSIRMIASPGLFCQALAQRSVLPRLGKILFCRKRPIG